MNNNLKLKTVSVVMTTYNGEKFVLAQLESIVAQTYPIFEIIIQDDCSTDNTWNILESYSKNYSNIKIYRNKTNICLPFNFLSAFEKATGDFIAPSDQDDIWLPNKIEQLICNIGDKNLIFSQDIIRNLDLNTETVSETDLPPIHVLIWGNTINGHTFLFKKDILKNITDLYLAFDFSLALVACLSDSYVKLNSPLSIWQRHQQVCTPIEGIKNKNFNLKINQHLKFIKSIFMILKFKRSNEIQRSLYNRYLLIKNNGFKKHQILGKVMLQTSKQNFISLLIAGYYNLIYAFYFLKKRKLKYLYFAFIKPYIYYFDMYFEKYLE